MTSRTRTSVGASPSAVARTVMSRSVTVPTRRSLSQTGSIPTSRDFILAAASWSVASGAAHATPWVITSFTRMGSLLSQGACHPFQGGALGHRFRERGLDGQHGARGPAHHLFGHAAHQEASEPG